MPAFANQIDNSPVIVTALKMCEVLRPFDSLDPGGEIRGQQTRISGLIREAPDGRESAVDRARRKLTRFQMDSIAGDNGFVERQSGLGAIPGDELFDGMPVSSLRFSRAGY